MIAVCTMPMPSLGAREILAAKSIEFDLEDVGRSTAGPSGNAWKRVNSDPLMPPAIALQNRLSISIEVACG